MIKKYFNNLKKQSLELYDLFCNDNRGLGTLEIVLIIIVILGLLVIFRDNVENIINSIFAKINSQVKSF